jgi:hypothetical protein
MSKLQPSQFAQYVFDDKELHSATLFTELNLQYIQTQLSMAMLERAALSYDPLKPITEFVQQEAALMGQMQAYRFLLDSHLAAVESVLQTEQSPDSQSSNSF